MNESSPLVVELQHGERFRFVAGLHVTALDELVIVLPASLLAATDKLGDVIKGDEEMGFRTGELGTLETLQFLLKPGMTLHLTKSCEAMALSMATPSSAVRLRVRKTL